MAFLFVIISSLLYLFAPISYSWEYCVICAVIYIFNACYGIVPKIKDDPINFDVFFSGTIFLCSFVFPIVVYPIDDTYSLFSFGYDPHVITKCTALVVLAHSMYWFGVSKGAKRYYEKVLVSNIQIDDKIVSKLANIVLVLFVLFISLGGLSYFTDRYLDGNMSTIMSFQYLKVLFSTLAVLLSCSCLYATDRNVVFRSVIILFVICVTILSTGSRTLPMYIMLPLFYIVQKKYNLSLLTMVGALVAFLCVFIVIGKIRTEFITIDAISSFEYSESEYGFFDNFIDFIVCNRNLYDIYSDVSEKGILYGKSFLAQILSVVPLAQGFVSSLFNIPKHELDSAYYCTYKVFGDQSTIGLGTHVVGDVYLATGIIGVIILFYGLGYFITKVRNGAIVKGDKFMSIIYLYMLSYSVFFCRGSFFGTVKGIIWSAFILYIFNNLKGNRINKNENNNTITY